MLQDTPAFSGYSVKDITAAETFYRDTLGLQVENTGMGLQVHTKGNTPIFIYEKADHQPATYTTLNFVVDDIDTVVDSLTAANVQMLHYEQMSHQDEKGIVRGRNANMGPDIAWFSDPAGNILAVLQN